ncbi:MAG: type II toxin-antitoxin system RelE/ParE family toxin [Bacillota bacterium]|nr:type II toxin-antitoxin system RelE/ParE family toxin [Bacillota bacterium]
MENNRHQIRYLPLAFEDLDGIDSYISDVLNNPAAAETLMTEIERAVEQLEQFPYIGSELEDACLAAKGYRKLVVENYLVFYIVNDERREVIIMRVMYGAREYRNLF